MSNATLAARISALIDKWNGYKNALRDMLTKQTGTVDMEDGTGAIVTLPTFPALQKTVTTITDTLTGAAAQAAASSSQASAFASASLKSATDSDTARAAAVIAKDAAAASATAADTSATTAITKAADAATSATLSGTKATAADASAMAAAGSVTTAKGYSDNAGFSAAAAQSSKDAAATSQGLALQYANAPVNLQVTPGNYSAFHWAEQARLTALGALIYRGKWSAASGAMPASPQTGDFYIVSVAGTVNTVKYGVGDMLIYDGAAWDRIDNQQVVTSVAGRTGNVVIAISDLAGLQGALDSKQNMLGFQPVQQGTGVGQMTNLVKLGYAGNSKLKLTVDVTDFGNLALESWVGSNYLPVAGGVLSGSLQSVQRTGNGAISNHQDGNPANGLHFAVQSNASTAAYMTFIRNGAFGACFGLDTDNQWRVGGWSYGNVSYRVIHEGVSNWSCPGQVAAATFAPYNAAGGYIRGNGSGVEVQGALWIVGVQNMLWANGGGWSRQPRMFVQGTDPGAAAQDGDLWIW